MRVPRMSQHLITLHSNYQRLPQGLGIFQVTDVPWMNDVEVAITDHILLLPKQIWQACIAGEVPDLLLRRHLLSGVDESGVEGTIAAKGPFRPKLLLVFDPTEPAEEFQLYQYPCESGRCAK